MGISQMLSVCRYCVGACQTCHESQTRKPCRNCSNQSCPFRCHLDLNESEIRDWEDSAEPKCRKLRAKLAVTDRGLRVELQRATEAPFIYMYKWNGTVYVRKEDAEAMLAELEVPVTKIHPFSQTTVNVSVYDQMWFHEKTKMYALMLGQESPQAVYGLYVWNDFVSAMWQRWMAWPAPAP